MKQQISQKPKRPRNHLAGHPLMRKGGVHQKTEKAERKATKQALRREYPVESINSTARGWNLVGFRQNTQGAIDARI